jgi:hypothetical protein
METTNKTCNKNELTLDIDLINNTQPKNQQPLPPRIERKSSDDSNNNRRFVIEQIINETNINITNN